MDLDCLHIKGTQNTEQRKVIVTFHGWQGNMESFLPLSKIKKYQKYDWYMLNGPYDVNNNPNKRTWSYEIKPNIWEIEKPRKMIESIFNNTIFKNYKSNLTYVIGFSLGATVCYEHICRINKPLGGIFPISGFCNDNKIKLNDIQINTPILIGHGLNDNIVPSSKSEEAFSILKKQSDNVELCLYDSGHRMSTKIIDAIANKIG